MASLKLGILQTDSVLEEFLPRFGDYPQMFEQLVTVAAARADPPLALKITSYATHLGTLPGNPGDEDAYLITGSRHSVYDDLPWIRELAAFLGRVLDARRKVVGICFGHQLLAHFFGGETRPAATGWCVGVHNTMLSQQLDWMRPWQASVGLLSSHRDQVAALPQGAELIASSARCPVAGFAIGDLVITLQGHPEFSKPYAAALMRKREQLLGARTFEAGIASLEQDTHEAVIASWILNFIQPDQPSPQMLEK